MKQGASWWLLKSFYLINTLGLCQRHQNYFASFLCKLFISELLKMKFHILSTFKAPQTLISRNFPMRTMVWKFTFTQKFCESNNFTKEITKELFWRNIFLVRLNFSFFHNTVLMMRNFTFRFQDCFCEFSVKLISRNIFSGEYRLFA